MELCSEFEELFLFFFDVNLSNGVSRMVFVLRFFLDFIISFKFVFWKRRLEYLIFFFFVGVY